MEQKTDAEWLIAGKRTQKCVGGRDSVFCHFKICTLSTSYVVSPS